MNAKLRGDAIVIQFSYNQTMIARLKEYIPSYERIWDADYKEWIIHPKHIGFLRGEGFPVKDSWPSSIKPKTINFNLIYLGKIKDGKAANGANEQEQYIYKFPADVLVAFFKASVFHSYYSILAIDREANQEQIKASYRRLAKQWHPDICKEPNAQEMFIALKEAFDVLSNQTLKARYDLISPYLSVTKTPINNAALVDWCPPYRCGRISASVEPFAKHFIIRKIISWNDITNSSGQTLVTSFSRGAIIRSWN